MQVSVIITVYNYAQYIERAIRSVFNQTLERSKYEIIIVNDASTDASTEILKNYETDIRLVNLEKNVGLAEARNIGIRKARGQFVVFLDADDYIHTELLRVQSLFLTENNNLDAVSVDYYLVDEKEKHSSHISADEKPIACGIMFRKERLFEIGLYDKEFRAREEEDLRKRFLKQYKIYNIILPLYRYRKHTNNLTNNKGEMKKYSLLLKKKHGK